MTRKDFELLARTLRYEIETADGQFEEHGAAALRAFAGSLATALGSTNERFDRDRFLTACGAS